MIVISGKTCSGKDSIVKVLVEKYGFHKIITTTSRAMRKGEKQDKDYHFVSNEKFQAKIDAGDFAEYKSYDTALGKWFYGVDKQDLIKADDKSVLIVTPQGYTDICKELGYKPFCIYIYANDTTIKQRLVKRGDNKAEAERRLAQDREDFAGFEYIANKIVHNNSHRIEDVAEKIVKYVEELDEK